jgi:hypothetical protein
MDTNDFDNRFRKECKKAEYAAKSGDRKQCKKFIEFLKDQMKRVSSRQIKTNFKLKNIEEATTWYTLFIYSGYDNYSKESKMKIMFSIVVEYIATHSPPEFQKQLIKGILQKEMMA